MAATQAIMVGGRRRGLGRNNKRARSSEEKWKRSERRGATTPCARARQEVSGARRKRGGRGGWCRGGGEEELQAGEAGGDCLAAQRERERERWIRFAWRGKLGRKKLGPKPS
jgi:hypothetical protein